MSGLIKPSRKLLRPTRRAFIAGAVKVWAAPAIVRAGSMTLLGVGGGASGTPFGITYEADAGSTTTGSSFTFTSQGIGTADPTRIVTVGIYDLITSGITVSSVTIGGISATQATGAAAASTTGFSQSDIWYAAVPTGTTATIVINLSASQSRLGIVVYSVIGTGAAFSSASGSGSTGNVSTLSASISTPSGGGTIAVIGIHNSSPGTVSSTNLTMDGSAFGFGSSVIQGGHNTSLSGSNSWNTSWSVGTDAALSVASFSP